MEGLGGGRESKRGPGDDRPGGLSIGQSYLYYLVIKRVKGFKIMLL